ncbi:MAG: hypothetical protein QXT43_01330 [Candidatus Micrarchaeaceae archaeon]
MASELFVVSLTLLAAAIAAYAQYIFKRYVKSFGLNTKEVLQTVFERHVLFGAALYVLSFAIYIYALHAAPIISFVYPIFASTFVFVFLISKFVLNEPVGSVRLLGIVLIVLGVLAVTATY